ncbi:MAG: hypothetical protein WAM67_15320, partial [Candidatus Acidiferrales bacterium]
MRGSADTAGMLDARSCRAFFRFEIACQDQPLKVKLESTPDFSHSEMRAARGPFSVMSFGHIVSLAFLSSSSVAAFRGPNSDSRNGMCFATSRLANKIIAPEALHSRAIFLSTRPNSSSEGERCMKDTVHPVVHFSVHSRIFGRVRNRRSCASRDDLIGRGQNTGLGWSDPTFGHIS